MLQHGRLHVGKVQGAVDVRCEERVADHGLVISRDQEDMQLEHLGWHVEQAAQIQHIGRVGQHALRKRLHAWDI